jgi:radical S-adenosyl methionine domain-containing protein 2
VQSYVAPLEDALRGLELLKAAGMEKVNFSGGEPFLKADMLGEMVQFCKKVE